MNRDNAMQLESPKKCHAHKRNGQQCSNWAIPGKKVCRMHGANAGRPIVTGKYSKVVKQSQSFRELREKHLNDPDLMELRDVVADLKAMSETLKDKLDNDTEPNLELIRAVMELSTSVSRVVKQKSEIDNNTALTAATVHVLQCELYNFVKSLPEAYQGQAIAFMRNTVMLADTIPTDKALTPLT